MTYDEFQSWLSELIEKAPATRRLAFARENMGLVLNSYQFDQVDMASQLSEAACAALLTARREVFTAHPRVLKDYLAIIDAGVLPGADGNVDYYLVDVIQGIDHWASYLDEKSTDCLLALANIVIDQIGYSADALDDFLAAPEMRAERDRIAALLAT